ncbi:MAG: hypothetical protein CMJ31_06185 [Phycisphaerae bacterium]|nr:hypothetical protein [Phycisphaerae bacterium]
MRLIIVRHGKAEPNSPDGSDAARPLAPRGRDQAAFLATSLERPIAAVISSPAVRARDTATAIAQANGLALEFDDRLIVDEPISPVLDLIADRICDSGALVLAGHNPQLGSLVGVLLGGPGAPSAVMKTGHAIVLELPDNAAGDAASLPGAAKPLGERRGE